jgi:hypothetical protein
MGLGQQQHSCWGIKQLWRQYPSCGHSYSCSKQSAMGALLADFVGHAQLRLHKTATLT